MKANHVNCLLTEVKFLLTLQKLFLLFLFSSLLLQASFGQNKDYYPRTIMAQVGVDQLNKTYLTGINQLATIGIAYHLPYQVNRHWDLQGNISASYLFNPMQNNTINIKGWKGRYILGYDLLNKNKYFQILASGGVEFGAIHLKDHINSMYKNNNFSFVFGIETGVRIKRFYFSIWNEYGLDSSKKRWKIKDAHLPLNDKFSFTGYRLNLGVGVVL